MENNIAIKIISSRTLKVVLKISAPIYEIKKPIKTPTILPKTVMNRDSNKNSVIMVFLFAPKDFYIPISLFRSFTETNITVIILRLATTKEIAPTADNIMVIMFINRIRPSFCLTILFAL